MLKFNCHIKGMAPLIFNRYPEEENPEGKSKQKVAVKSADEQVYQSLYWLKPTSFEDFLKFKKDNSYKMPIGLIYQPAEHIIGSMIKAAVNFKLEGKKTFKDVIKAGLFVEPLKIPHLVGTLEKDWRPVVIPKQRARVMKGRGRLDEWELKFQAICSDLRATAKDIEDILKYAGAYGGIGDFRPRYGRFEVIEFEEIKS